MKNNLMKFAQKILFQDKILKILTTLILAAPPIILTIWCVIHEATAIDLQLILFKFSVIYLIAFMFLSYEYIYKLKSNSLIECVDTTPKGTKSIIKSKISLLCAVASVQTLVLILINVFFAISEGSLTLQYLLYIIVSILLNIFLICIAGIFIGSFSALKMKKIPAYLLMIFITIMTSRILDILWLALYTTTNIDIFKITGLFELTTPSTNWTPNTAFGYSVLPYRFAVILFWIFIFAFGIIFSLHQINKRKIKAITCIILSIICITVYYTPSSKVIMDQRNVNGPNADYEYYTKHEDEIMIEKNNFNMTDLTMDISTNSMLKAKVVIKVDNKNLEKYKFTLYHGYKISKITDGNNDELDFTRDSDYLTINNTSKSKLIKIYYHGSCDKYYSNYLSAFLPGNFAFYPIPGFNEMYSKYSYSGFNNLSLPYETDFNVTVHSLKKVQCNLESVTNNEFKGKSDSLTLLSGFIDCVTVDKTQIYYPYFNDAYNSDTINEKLETFVSENPNIKKIFIIPDINLEDIEFVKTFNDYMITASIDDIDRLGFISKISANKMELYDAVNAYMNYPEYFEFLKENSSEELQKAIPVLEEVLKNDNDCKKLEKINGYLIDNADERSFSEFLCELR